MKRSLKSSVGEKIPCYIYLIRLHYFPLKSRASDSLFREDVSSTVYSPMLFFQ